jgi:micrococcal nuclease
MNARLPALLLVASALVACHPASRASASFPITGATALDGDTFRWSGQRYRLAGIDAPELPGHCRGYRLAHGTCAPGDPYASRAMLQSLLNAGIICTDLGPDYYHRRLVDCRTPDDADIGALLIASGNAIPYSYHGRPQP